MGENDILVFATVRLVVWQRLIETLCAWCCHKVTSLAPGCWTPTNLGGGPVDHRFEEAWWEASEADVLVGVVGWNLHQVVRSVWVDLNGVISAARLIHDLLDRTHIRFDTLRRIKLTKDCQQRGL